MMPIRYSLSSSVVCELGNALLALVFIVCDYGALARRVATKGDQHISSSSVEINVVLEALIVYACGSHLARYCCLALACDSSQCTFVLPDLLCGDVAAQ
jgi:hypothetical protein